MLTTVLEIFVLIYLAWAISVIVIFTASYDKVSTDIERSELGQELIKNLILPFKLLYAGMVVLVEEVLSFFDFD